MRTDEQKLLALERRLAMVTRESDQRLAIARARIQCLEEELMRRRESDSTPLPQIDFDERELVITQLERIARSGTWRWGHRLASLKWRLMFRRHRETDAVTQLLVRLRTPALMGAEPRDGTAELPDAPTAPPEADAREGDQDGTVAV